jgi:hypothetical protein
MVADRQPIAKTFVCTLGALTVKCGPKIGRSGPDQAFAWRLYR